MAYSSKCPLHALYGFLAIASPDNNLANQRIVISGMNSLDNNGCQHAHQDHRGRYKHRFVRARQEVAIRIFGVNPAFDCVPVDFYIFLLE